MKGYCMSKFDNFGYHFPNPNSQDCVAKAKEVIKVFLNRTVTNDLAKEQAEAVLALQKKKDFLLKNVSRFMDLLKF